jgi:hypothetical protein
MSLILRLFACPNGLLNIDRFRNDLEFAEMVCEFLLIGNHFLGERCRTRRIRTTLDKGLADNRF